MLEVGQKFEIRVGVQKREARVGREQFICWISGDSLGYTNIMTTVNVEMYAPAERDD